MTPSAHVVAARTALLFGGDFPLSALLRRIKLLTLYHKGRHESRHEFLEYV
jgi:hypothetical protein